MNDIDSCIESTLEFFYKHFETKELCAKWLTTKKMVREFYDGNSDNINKVQIPDDVLIASDLGSQGSSYLFLNRILR